MGKRILSAMIVGAIVSLGGMFCIWMGTGLKAAGPGAIFVASLIFGLIAAIVTFFYDKPSGELGRFIKAQQDSYDAALAELKAGRKTGHWIWWIFPQLKGLGTSHNSSFYGLADEDEAADYLEHPVLGARYHECVAVVHGHLCRSGVPPLTLMGSEVDVLKLRSSLSLFLGVAPPSDETFRAQARAILNVLG